MTATTFKHCYRTLHVPPDCSWTELRLAYRRRVRNCHPDRRIASAGTPERDDEFKEVVRAFRALATFHRRHGELPPPWLPITSDAPPPRVRADAPSTESREKPRRRLRWQMKRDWRMPRLHKAVVSAFLLGVATSAILGHLGDTYNAHAQPTRSDGRIAVGMDPQSVVEVQGVPSYTIGSVWFYGESGVIFERGCVVGWENQPPFPLRTLSGMSYLSRTAAKVAGCATESY